VDIVFGFTHFSSFAGWGMEEEDLGQSWL